MSDLRAIAGRAGIEARRGEFTGAVMMRDSGRRAPLVTPGSALPMPDVPGLAGREQIRARDGRVPASAGYPALTTRPGTIQAGGGTASGRAYPRDLIGPRHGRPELNCAIYHDRYQHTRHGWKCVTLDGVAQAPGRGAGPVPGGPAAFTAGPGGRGYPGSVTPGLPGAGPG